MSKSKSKRIMTMGLSAVLGSCLLITGVSATTGTKKISAFYNNIKVSYNGEQKYLSQEPFMYNNTVYVPVRGISEISGAEVKWGNNTVSINQAAGTNINGGTVGNIDQQMADKNYQIAKLTNERDTLKKKLEQYEGTGASGSASLTDPAIEATEKYLNDNYCDYHKVDWDINLEKKGSRLSLKVEYDSKYDDNDFNRIKGRKLEEFLKELCDETQNRHKGVAVTGDLTDLRHDTLVGTFSYSTSARFEYDAEKLPESLRDFGDTLLRSHRSIDNIPTGTDNKAFTLPVNTIELRERSSSINVVVYVDMSADNKTHWNDLRRSGEIKTEDFLRRIIDDIEREYKVSDVQGEIKDYGSSNTIFSFDGSRSSFITLK